MKSTLKISLKANEKIYINGAVVRFDRKVTLEFLNDVQFLLENHVLQPEDASTPLRQLYFIVQVMRAPSRALLCAPRDSDAPRGCVAPRGTALFPATFDSVGGRGS